MRLEDLIYLLVSAAVMVEDSLVQLLLHIVHQHQDAFYHKREYPPETFCCHNDLTNHVVPVGCVVWEQPMIEHPSNQREVAEICIAYYQNHSRVEEVCKEDRIRQVEVLF